MKHIVAVFLVSTLLFSYDSVFVGSISLADEGKQTVGTEKKGLKSILDSIWTKIRTLSPKKKKRTSGAAVAGVKGAEKGSEELSPYWKGDGNARLNEEIERYAVAEELMEEGKYSEAIVAINSFREEFPASRFLPNLLFAKGLCYLRLDRMDEATKEFGDFLEDYPDHEMVADANKLLVVIDKDTLQ